MQMFAVVGDILNSEKKKILESCKLFVMRKTNLTQFFRYVSGVLELQGHMSRLNHRDGDDENVKSINCMKINFEHEYPLLNVM